MSPQKLVVFIAVMMMLLGVTTYVVFQDNGIYEREVKPLLTNEAEEVNTTISK